jgi:hypothetical protein
VLPSRTDDGEGKIFQKQTRQTFTDGHVTIGMTGDDFDYPPWCSQSSA